MLFVIDPLESLVPGHDTSLAVMEEADRRDHSVWWCTLHDLRLARKKPEATLRRIRYAKKKWEEVEKRDLPLEKMNIIFMRKDPPFNIDYVMATSILSYTNKKRTIILNDPDALRTFNEKLGIFEFTEYIPDTIVTKCKGTLASFLKKHKKIVLKPLELNSGHGIFVLEHGDKNRGSLLEMMTDGEQKYIMAQRYLPEIKHGDKRVIILDGEVIGAVNRIAPPHDHRSNLHTGATPRKIKLTADNMEMCQDIAKRLKTMGIYFAGLDLIGNYITEINVTSPTGIVEIEKLYGVQLQRNVVDFFEKISGSGAHRLARRA